MARAEALAAWGRNMATLNTVPDVVERLRDHVICETVDDRRAFMIGYNQGPTPDGKTIKIPYPLPGDSKMRKEMEIDIQSLLVKRFNETGTFFGKRDLILKTQATCKQLFETLFDQLASHNSSQFLLTGEKPAKPVKVEKKPKHGLLEGFWLDPEGDDHETSNYPDVRKLSGKRAFKGKHPFLALLAIVQSKSGRRHFKGWSTCRICGKRNGSTTFTYKGYSWPEGYEHYISAHNVRPTQDFVDFIKANAGGKKFKAEEVATRKPTDGWTLPLSRAEKPKGSKKDSPKKVTKPKDAKIARLGPLSKAIKGAAAKKRKGK